MQYGICNLSIIPLRKEPISSSELLSQVLYGEIFKILEQRKNWSRIHLAFDKYEGWINNKQYREISEVQYKAINEEGEKYTTDLVEFVKDENEQLYPISIGSSLNGLSLLKHFYNGNSTNQISKKDNLINTAFLYLNAPTLNGGKTPFGIDASGFVQMVYKLNGFKLLREVSQQATQGEPLSFIEESESGDLAFFDNADGEIIHVGIIMEDNYIIHAFGKVKIDRLDHSGIYCVETRTHTHKLRVIKKIIS